MVVKIVGSTPTIRTINESEVVSVLDTEQNKQIYETGRGVQTLRFAKEQIDSREVQSQITRKVILRLRSRRDKAQSNRGAPTVVQQRYLTHLPVSFYKLNTIIDG